LARSSTNVVSGIESFRSSSRLPFVVAKTLHELAQRRERRRIAKARRGDQLGQTSVTPDVTDV
jgi:hypothetical protein